LNPRRDLVVDAMTSEPGFAAWRAEVEGLATPLRQEIDALVCETRDFFYRVVLIGRSCARCNGQLAMQREGECLCTACNHRFDPTTQFQQCDTCDGKARIRQTRYACRKCGGEIVSRFLFDGKVFDSEYFRRKMAESRERRHRQPNPEAERFPVDWSAAIAPASAELDSIPGLLAALDALTRGEYPTMALSPADEFNLQQYERHIQAHLGPIALPLDEIPPLNEVGRRDRIWRFIAVIFMAHAGIVDIQQQHQVIMVTKREINRERPGIPGDTQDPDHIEGLVG